MDQLFPEFHVIIVPGLHDSSAEHWQSRWHRAHPEWSRVVQDDWDRPDLAAWADRLGQVRRSDPRPALFIAHSFGCLTTVHSIARDGRNLAGALLVAPADPEKFGVADQLPALALPCPTLLINSSNDPWMPAERAAAWAARWRAQLVEGGALGHINAESGLGDWRDGQRSLQRLVDLAQAGRVACAA